MLLPSMTSKRIACGPPFHNFTFYSIPQNRADGGGFAQKKPLPLGEVSPKVTERASPLPNSYCTAMSRAFDRAVLSLCLGVSVSSLALSGACAPRPGCGTQRLLRCRLHPAGRCPNSSSLFPPLAAVVAVAPKGRATGVSVRLCLDEQSLYVPKTGVPCYQGQQLLDNECLF